MSVKLLRIWLKTALSTICYVLGVNDIDKFVESTIKLKVLFVAQLE